MLPWFQRNRDPLTTSASPALSAKVSKGLTRPQSAAILLATPRRRRLLEHIWQRTSLSRQQFQSLYRIPLERYAELVQQFPASDSHHHAYPGGMLDHGLEVVAYALKLRQFHLLPAGAMPETQATQADAWTAGTAYAALLHDIGKIAVDIQVEYADESVWHPWHGPVQRPYRFRYRKDRAYRLHGAATGLLYTELLDREILDWLCQYPDLWSSLLYVLAGQYENADTLGELVIQADQASVAQALGGDPSKAIATPQHSLQRKLLDGLRYLLKEEFKLNQPQASDGWLTTDTLWLVSKTVSDKLRAYLLSQGIEGIPSSNTVLFNILQDHGIVQPTPDNKAIWKATITSEGGWSHPFTFLKLSPAMIWDAEERPVPFTGMVTLDIENNASTVLEPILSAPAQRDESQAAGPASPALLMPSDNVGSLLTLLGTNSEPDSIAEAAAPVTSANFDPHRPRNQDGIPSRGSAEIPSGEHFVSWLRLSVQSRRLVINDAKALVHTVDGTAYLVSPGVFQRYAQEYPQTAQRAKLDNVADWQWVQKRFEKLGLHRKQANGLNIWTCEVKGTRKSRRVHGYLLAEPETLFHNAPPDNPYLTPIQD